MPPVMPARLPYRLCDVFTERALTGNPLAVFTDARGLDDATMQALAREMNLSESTFVLPGGDDCDARLRIFTPKIELPFAGHPTLGTAAVLAARGAGEESLRLGTAAGVIPVRLTHDPGRPPFGWMRQPLPRHARFASPEALLAALGLDPVAGAAGRAGAPPVEVYDNGNQYVYVALDTPAAVAALRPDMARLAALGPLLVSVFAPDGPRWRCRVFGPSAGVPEDPATGSAAGPLAYHLARHGRIGFGDEIVIEQGLELGRPSRLHARALGSAARLDALEVGGRAVVIGGGELWLDAPGAVPERSRTSA
jgi:trans-2,3-dihydro-3-hydroxyanthranilate isomerase